MRRLFVRVGWASGLYHLLRTDKPCHSCGNKIQPGQLYMPEKRGPRHLGC